MARIRSIHPGIWTDEAFVSCSDAARLVFIGLLGECDDRGVFEWKPLQLKMRLRPVDNTKMETLLQELSDQGLIRQLPGANQKLGAVRNFCRWQRPKSPQFLFEVDEETLLYVAFKESAEQPERGTALAKMLCEGQNNACFYCAAEITFYRKKANSCELDHKTPISRGGDDIVHNLVAACKPCNMLKGAMTEGEFRAKFTRDELLSRHAKGSPPRATVPFASCENNIRNTRSPPKEENPPQMEDGGDKGKMEEEVCSLRSPRLRSTGNDDFDQFWLAYPRKVGKADAQKALAKALKRATMAEIMLGLSRQQWPADAQFIPHPERWLNGGRWQDDPSAAAPAPPERPSRHAAQMAKLSRLLGQTNDPPEPDLLAVEHVGAVQ